MFTTLKSYWVNEDELILIALPTREFRKKIAIQNNVLQKLYKNTARVELKRCSLSYIYIYIYIHISNTPGADPREVV